MKRRADQAAPTRRGALCAALAAAAALLAARLPRARSGANPPPAPRRPRWIGHG
jgi:hypothetical protein